MGRDYLVGYLLAWSTSYYTKQNLSSMHFHFRAESTSSLSTKKSELTFAVLTPVFSRSKLLNWMAKPEFFEIGSAKPSYTSASKIRTFGKLVVMTTLLSSTTMDQAASNNTDHSLPLLFQESNLIFRQESEESQVHCFLSLIFYRCLLSLANLSWPNSSSSYKLFNKSSFRALLVSSDAFK